MMQVVADDRAGSRDGAVVLADVNAVGAGLQRQVGAVVEDEQRSSGRAELARDRCVGQQLCRLRALVAQLEDVDAAAQRRRAARRPASDRPGRASQTKYRRVGAKMRTAVAHAD